jgi:hypothetical protein
MGFAALMSIAIPPHSAIADSWKKHHDERVIVVAPRYVPAPPVVYFAPRPVYVVPQPRVYVAPPPVYYGPPSLNITVPLRIPNPD